MTLTAIGNDYGYDRVFARQVEAIASPGDVLVAISTSGNSPNVVAAAKVMRSIGGKVLALTGILCAKLLSEGYSPLLVVPAQCAPSLLKKPGMMV